MKRLFLSLAILVSINLFIARPNIEAQTIKRDKEFFFKSDTLIKICLYYSSLKDHKTAARALDTAYRIAKHIKEPNSRAIILNEIVDKYMLMGENELAYRVVGYIALSDVQSEAFFRIAYKATELRDFGFATKVTKQIKDPFSKAKAFYRIVYKLDDLGLYEQAIKYANEFEQSQILIDEFLSAEYLARELLKEKPEFSPKNLIIGGHSLDSVSQDELYNESNKLTQVADQYLDLFLFGLCKKTLIKASLIAGKLDSQLLKQDVSQKIALADKRRIKLEKYYKIPEDKQ